MQVINQIGDLITWEVKVRNNGPSTTKGVSVGLAFSVGQNFSYAGASKGSYNHTDKIWTVGSLFSGEEVTLLIGSVVTDLSPDFWTVVYNVAGNNLDPFQANNTTTLTVTKSDSIGATSCCTADKVDLSASITGLAATNVQAALEALAAGGTSGGGGNLPDKLTTLSWLSSSSSLVYVDELNQVTTLDLSSLAGGGVDNVVVTGNTLTVTFAGGNTQAYTISLNAGQVPFTSNTGLVSTSVRGALDELNIKINNFSFSETITSLTVVGNVLRYTREDGTIDSVDLSLYVDDTNLARLVSGVLDSNGLATFTRDDGSTFTVDFSGFLGDVAASDVSVTDAGNFFGGTDVEAILQEIGNIIATGSDGVITGFTTSGTTLFAQRSVGNPVSIDLAGMVNAGETITSLTLLGKTLTYESEDDTYILDLTPLFTAAMVTFNNTGTDLVATNVEAAIKEINDKSDFTETVTSLSISGDNLTYVKEDGTLNVIDLGVYRNSPNAAGVPVADASNFFAGTNVEAVLQEIGNVIATGSDGVVTGFTLSGTTLTAQRSVGVPLTIDLGVLVGDETVTNISLFGNSLTYQNEAGASQVLNLTPLLVAGNISYDSSGNALTTDNVQEAIDEILTLVSGTGIYNGSGNIPANTIATLDGGLLIFNNPSSSPDTNRVMIFSRASNNPLSNSGYNYFTGFQLADETEGVSSIIGTNDDGLGIQSEVSVTLGVKDSVTGGVVRVSDDISILTTPSNRVIISGDNFELPSLPEVNAATNVDQILTIDPVTNKVRHTSLTFQDVIGLINSASGDSMYTGSGIIPSGTKATLQGKQVAFLGSSGSTNDRVSIFVNSGTIPSGFIPHTSDSDFFSGITFKDSIEGGTAVIGLVGDPILAIECNYGVVLRTNESSDNLTVLNDTIFLSAPKVFADKLPEATGALLDSPLIVVDANGRLYKTDNTYQDLTSKADSSIYEGSGTIPAGTTAKLASGRFAFEDPNYPGQGILVMADADESTLPVISSTKHGAYRTGFLLDDANDSNIGFIGLCDSPGLLIESPGGDIIIESDKNTLSGDRTTIASPAFQIQSSELTIDDLLVDSVDPNGAKKTLVWSPVSERVSMKDEVNPGQDLHTVTATGGETSLTRIVPSGTPYAVMVTRQGSPGLIETVDYTVAITGSTVVVTFEGTSLIANEIVQLRILTK